MYHYLHWCTNNLHRLHDNYRVIVVCGVCRYTSIGVPFITFNFELVLLGLGFHILRYFVRPEPLRVRWGSNQYRSYK